VARTLSATITGLIAQDTQRICHLLTFTVGATTYRFTDGDAINHLGNAYLSHLVFETGPRYSEKLRNEPVTVKLQNIDLATANTLRIEGTGLQGQEATLERLFLAARETVVLFKGRISEMEVNDRDATLTLSGELDPTGSQVPKRKYSPLCMWDFKDVNCGYVDGVDPNDPGTGQPYAVCGKTFPECQVRSREERFPGFLHITRDLTLAIEGQSPGYEPEEGALSALLEP